MFIPCMVTIGVGVINVGMYFGRFKEYEKTYDKTMRMATNMYTHQYQPVHGDDYDDREAYGGTGYDFSNKHPKPHKDKKHKKGKKAKEAPPAYSSKFTEESGSY